MTQQPEQPMESEPVDSGTEPIQTAGSPIDTTALVKARARGPLEGHPLPEALRDIGPAFRSNPVWILVCQWTNQVIGDHQNLKNELSELKGKLEATQSELNEKKIQCMELTQKLAAQARIATSKTRWQVMGSLFLGLSPAAYFNTAPIYGYLLGGVGLLFLYFAWREETGK